MKQRGRLSKTPLFEQKPESGHGRIENRCSAAAAISPVSAGLAGACSVIKVERAWRAKNAPEEPTKTNTRYFISSLDVDQKQKASRAVRGHWAVENANHYRRDTCSWREDDHRHRRSNVAQNLALTRNALLAIIPFDETQRLGHLLDHYHRNSSQAIKLILHARPI